jgi:hypothetical protein
MGTFISSCNSFTEGNLALLQFLFLINSCQIGQALPDLLQCLENQHKIEGLAKEIGCGSSNVGMWAKGSFPGFNKLLKLVELGMTMEEIFGTKLYKEFILPNFEKRVCEVLIKHLSEGAR